MALEKEHTLTTGVVGNYWRLDTITYNARTKIVRAAFGLYIDQAASLKYEPLQVENKVFRNVSKEVMISNAMEALYTLAKVSVLDEDGEETNIFVNATDLL
jgi:hypothetical protein